jgi:pyochelin biosynthetic protein PchC
VLAIHYPGRTDRHKEPCLENIADLADYAAVALEDFTGPDDPPYALFGHSLGATVAFEVACRLEECGEGPTTLFASGRRAPSRHREEAVHKLPDAELVAHLGELAGTDERLLSDPDAVAMILPSVRADYKAAETYRHWPQGPRLRCPVHVVIGDGDPQVDEAEARAWTEHTEAECDLTLFPGGHFYLNDWPVEVVAHLAGKTPRPVQAG